MKQVLGMAKRHLDLRGAKVEKVELDYLRLAEVLLRRLVKEREDEVRCVQTKAQFPFAIQWDYYGVAAGH